MKRLIDGYGSIPEENYLMGIDKGIFTAKFKQRILITIAASMILRGAIETSLALSSAVFFVGMEFIFLTYDSSKALESAQGPLPPSSVTCHLSLESPSDDQEADSLAHSELSLPEIRTPLSPEE